MRYRKWIFNKFVRERGLDYAENDKSYNISEKTYNEVVESIKHSITSPRDDFNYYFDKRSKRVLLEYADNDSFKKGRAATKNNVLLLPRKADFDSIKAMRLFAARQQEPAKAELTKALSGMEAGEKFAAIIGKYELDREYSEN